jgi:BTB/POZ domain-containing protein 9
MYALFSFPQQEDVILDILGLSHQYGFVDLEASISDYLREILQIRNVCIIFDAARVYQLQFLTRVCSSFMDRHALDIIHHETFVQLSAVRKKYINIW